MFTLRKVHLAQAKKEFSRSKKPTEKSRDLEEAFTSAIAVLSTSSLYGLQVSAMITRIVKLYFLAAAKNIGTGRVNEDWTQEKIRISNQLKVIIEKALKERGKNCGENFMSELMLEIDSFSKEYLPNQRREYQDKTNWEPSRGNFEVTYLPMIELSIDLLYRIYCLYQLENTTKADFRSRDEDAVILLQTAEAMAEESIRLLLEPLDMVSLKQAEVIIESIERQNEQLFVMNSAAEGAPSQPQGNKINKTRLLSVYGAFSVEIDKKDERIINEALHNIGTYVKRGAAVTMGAVGAVGSLAASGSAYLAEGAMNLITGPLEGKNVRDRKKQILEDDFDDDDEDDDEVIEQGASPIEPKNQVSEFIWDYRGTKAGYSPSLCTAPKPSPVLDAEQADETKVMNFELT